MSFDSTISPRWPSGHATSQRASAARLVTLVSLLVSGMLGVLLVPAATAAVPPPTTSLQPLDTQLTVGQNWNRIGFSFNPSEAAPGDEHTVSFNGRACVTTTGQNPTAKQSCTIYSTGNEGGTATLARNRYGNTTILDSVEIVPLEPGDCGDLNRCPEVRVTQFPDSLQFEWDGPTGASRDHVIVDLDGKTCRASANKAPEAPFRCTINDTDDAGGIATLTSYTTATSFVITGILIEPLGPGKCGARPRCFDAPLNLTAEVRKDQSVKLDWQSHDGSETSDSGYQVLMSVNGQPPTPVCEHLLRYLYQDERGPAASECEVADLELQVNYDFTVSHYGRGRAVSMEATVSAAISFADWGFDYRWRAETEGTLYLRFEWDSTSSDSSNSKRISVESEAGNCTGGDGRFFCEVQVSKATGDALPRTFEARLELFVANKARTLNVLTATRPPTRPSDPTNLRVDAGKTSATISWDHPARSTAVLYGVWLTGPGLPTCQVDGPLSGNESCRLNNLSPGTRYTVHVYAQDEIGQRSETPSRSFTTDTAPQTDQCGAEGTFTKKRDRAIERAEKQFAKKVERVTDRLENKPKRLARKVRKLATKRDAKITKAEQRYDSRC